MAYLVISPFADSQDKSKEFPDGRIYVIGDSFPSMERKISEDRIKKLMSCNNTIGRAVIEVASEGVDKDGSSNGSGISKGKSRNKK